MDPWRNIYEQNKSENRGQINFDSVIILVGRNNNVNISKTVIIATENFSISEKVKLVVSKLLSSFKNQSDHWKEWNLWS